MQGNRGRVLFHCSQERIGYSEASLVAGPAMNSLETHSLDPSCGFTALLEFWQPIDKQLDRRAVVSDAIHGFCGLSTFVPRPDLGLLVPDALDLAVGQHLLIIHIDQLILHRGGAEIRNQHLHVNAPLLFA